MDHSITCLSNVRQIIPSFTIYKKTLTEIITILKRRYPAQTRPHIHHPSPLSPNLSELPYYATVFPTIPLRGYEWISRGGRRRSTTVTDVELSLDIDNALQDSAFVNVRDKLGYVASSSIQKQGQG